MKRLDAFEGVLAVASRGGAGAAVVSWTVFEIRGPRYRIHLVSASGRGSDPVSIACASPGGTIVDLVRKKLWVLVPDAQSALEADVEAKPRPYPIERTGRRRRIQGHVCEEWRSVLHGGHALSWHADGIRLVEASGDAPLVLHLLDSPVALESTVHDAEGGVVLRQRATAVVQTRVAPSRLAVLRGYRVAPILPAEDGPAPLT
jgi:hypothetical protein